MHNFDSGKGDEQGKVLPGAQGSQDEEHVNVTLPVDLSLIVSAPSTTKALRYL
jgi:hypothetical protein